MKGVVFEEIKKVVVKEDLPKPKIRKDEVLIRVKKCGICGSDIESYLTGSLMLTGITLGHEFAGEIVELGESVKKWKIGDRVTANPNLPCGKCYWCQRNLENMCKNIGGLGLTENGAFAEFIKVRQDRLHKLPESMTFEEGASVEPAAVCIYAVQASGFSIGENAVVIGAGTIGLYTIQVLKAAGASNIYAIEPVETQAKKALEVGATEVFEPKNWSKINKLTNKVGPDHVFDCVGLPETHIDSLKMIRTGGTITVIGLHAEPFEMKGFHQLALKNITMRGTYCYTQDSFKTALDMLARKKIIVKPIITKKISLDEVPEAFELLTRPGNTEVKIMVEP
ncbi:MAG: zinc-dependent alcohol dehydrogenase [Candidatus Helarchaeales archaeon]